MSMAQNISKVCVMTLFPKAILDHSQILAINLFSNKPINGWGLPQACRFSYPFILLQGVGSRTITERLVEFSTLATQAQAFPRADPNANSNHQPATLVSTNIAG